MNDRRLHVIMICTALIAAVCLAFALHWLRPVMIPFVLAILLMYGLAPLVDWISTSGRVGRGFAIVLALLLSGLALTAIGQLVRHSIQALADDADLYAHEAEIMAKKASVWLSGWGISTSGFEESVRSMPVSKWVRQLVDGLLGFVSNGFLVLIFLIYLLLGRTPPPAEGGGLRAEIERRVKRYIVVKVGLSAATGVATAVILQLLGVNLAVVFGLLAFFLNFIPNIGSIVATVLPLSVVLFDPNASGLTVVLAVVLPGAVQLSVGNVLEPKVLGSSLDLHPITILVTLIFWGMLWGVVGMILATPVTAVMKILFEYSDLTRPLARLMAGEIGEPERPDTDAA